MLSWHQQDIQSARAKHHPSQQPQDSCQPGQVRDKDSGPLVATKVSVISDMATNFTTIMNHSSGL